MEAVTITQITPSELQALIENSILKILSQHPINNSKELDEELLTVNEAAEILRLSVPTIYGLMHKGDLSYMKRSKRCYFTKIDLMNYLKEGRRQSTLEKRTAAEQYLKNKKG